MSASQAATGAHDPSPSSSRHALFGGGLSADLPANLIDASDLRQIPDTQEVWLSPDSDVTYIIEILEAVPGEAKEALNFHFDSLAHDNDALSSSVSSTTVPPASTSTPLSPPNQPLAWTLSGTQRVRKFGKEKDEDEVRIFMSVWRIADKNTDIVLTVNCPQPALEAFAQQQFERAVTGFRVEDWGLFAG